MDNIDWLHLIDLTECLDVQNNLFFFQNEEIMDQLDDLDELDRRITHVWIGFNYSLTQAEKRFQNND